MRLKITTPGREFEETIGDGKSSVMVGNRALDDITIEDDPDVSGPHVRIERFAGTWSFTDQFSGGGTFHNGEKKYNGDLVVGDVLKVGATQIRVVALEGSSAESSPSTHVAPPVAEPPSELPKSSAPTTPVDNIVGWIMRELDPDELAYIQARPDALVEIRKAAKSAVVDLQTTDEVEVRLSFDRPEENYPFYLNADLYPRYLNRVAPPFDEDEDWEPPEESDTPVSDQNDEPDSSPEARPESQKEVREPPPIFLERIAYRLIREFEKQHGFDPCRDSAAKQRIIDATRKAVIELESVKQTQVDLPFLVADSSGPKHLNVTIERRHLHEDADHFKDESDPLLPVQRAAARKGKSDAARKAFAGVGVGIGVLVVATVFTLSEWYITPSEDEPVARSEPAVTAEDDRAEELRLQKKVQALMTSEDASPQELLTQLNQYESQARVAGYSIGWDYERCRTHLETRVHRDVSQRYNECARTLFDLREANNYRQAQANVDDLRSYLNSSPHNVRSMGILDLDETMDRWGKGHHKDSDRFVAEQILIAQEAVSREDYEPAAAALQAVADGALIDEHVIQACLTLSQSLAAKEGDVRKPFHYRDRPPKSPANDLLPNGDSSGYTRLNTYMKEVVKELRAGERREFDVWGMHVEAGGEERTSQLTVTYTLGVGPGVKLKGTHKSMLSNLPDAVRLALLAEDKNLTVDELTGLLVFAFDNGLFNQAGEISYRIRSADPDSAVALDEVLSAKWGTPVPEGGFPERGGRVVRE